MASSFKEYTVSHLIRDGILEVGDGYRAKNSEMSPTGLPFIRAGNLNGQIDTEHCELLGFDSVRLAGNKISRYGDVALTTKGTIGRIAFVDSDTKKFIYSPQICYWRVLKQDKLCPRFLFYAMKGPAFKHQMDWSSGQTDMAPYISLTDQRTAFKIEFPCIEYQQAIASILGSLDDKIDLNRRMNETLESMARAIFKDWFVDFGPTRAKMEGRAPYLAPEMWELFPGRLDEEGKPEGWRLKPVYDMAVWTNGAAYSQEHFSDDPYALPIVKIAELKSGISANTKHSVVNLGDKYKIHSGELLFSWSGNPDTSIDTFIWSHGEAWLNQHIFSVRENGECSVVLLYSLLKYLKPRFSEIARNKQTTGLGHVTKNDLQNLFICIGDCQTRKAFDRLVGPLDQNLRSNIREDKTLARTRDLLLPKLMSGEIRVKDAEKAVENVL
ncbi:restriction endonuclease subunit S [Fundidesulfovibrio soli]|uniref:restriction endonuclease subunit S n=1 Tax=Fundidesulfovibrio soli TaxID=2922716 RepID=UPI001FAEB91A